MSTSQFFLSNPPTWTNITCSSVACQQPVIIEGESLPPVGTPGQVCALDGAGALIATDSLGAKSATTLNVSTQLNLQGSATLQTPLASGYLTSTAGLVGSATTIPAAAVSGLPTFPVGSIVGTTDNQVLTTKTIDGVSNTLSNIPQAAVTGLSTTLADKLATAGGSVTGGIYPAGGGIPLGLNTNRFSSVFTTGIDTNTLTTTIPSGYIKSVGGILGSSGTTVPVGEVSGLPTFPASAIVGVSDNQTLTTKTISGSNNTLSNIAQASVTNLSTDLGNRMLKSGDTLTGTILVTPNNTHNLGSIPSGFANVYTNDLILAGTSLQSRLTVDELDIRSNTLAITQYQTDICPQPIGSRWLVGLPSGSARSVGYYNGVIYVGTVGLGGYYSTNGGASYTANNLPVGYFVSDHNGVYACAMSLTANQPSYLSADGITWTAGSNIPFGHLEFPPNGTIRWVGSRFIAMTNVAGGVSLASSPDGVSWVAASTPVLSCYSIVPTGGSRAMVCTNSTSYFTTNAGLNWTIATGAPTLFCAAYSPLANHVIGIQNQIGAIGAYVSVDGGATYLQSSVAITPLVSTWLTAACYDSATQRMLFMGHDPITPGSFVFASLKDGGSRFVSGRQPEGAGAGVIYGLHAFNDGGSDSNKLATSKYVTCGLFGGAGSVSSSLGYLPLDQSLAVAGNLNGGETVHSYLPVTCALENRISTFLTATPAINFTANTLTPIAVATTQDIAGYQFSVNTANGTISYAGPTKTFEITFTIGGSTATNQSNQSLSFYARKNALVPKAIARVAMANANIPIGGSATYWTTLTAGDTVSSWATSTVTVSFTFTELYVSIRSLYN